MEGERSEENTAKTLWTFAVFKNRLLDSDPPNNNELPNIVHLSQVLYNDLSTLVCNTKKTGNEWALTLEKVWRKGTANPTLFRHGPKEGSKTLANPPTTTEAILAKYGLEPNYQLVGGAHSHPNNGPIWIGDLVGMISDKMYRTEIVAISQGTFAAVRSRETPYIPVTPYTTESEITKEITKIARETKDRRVNQAMLMQLKNKSSEWFRKWEGTLMEVSNACQSCSIGLYFGFPNDHLHRIV